MATVSGGGNTFVLDAGSNDRNGTAAALADAISAELAAGSLIASVDGSSSSNLPTLVLVAVQTVAPFGPPVKAFLINAGGPTTVVGSGTVSEQIIGNSAPILFALRGGTGTVVLGDGNDTVSTNNLPTTGFAITTGSGNDLILGSTGNNTINAGGGLNTIGTGSGNSTVFLNGRDTVWAGTGAETINGGADSALIYVANSTLNFFGGSGGATIGGGTGNSTIALGTGSLYFVGGTGSATVLAGVGSTTVFAGSGGGVFRGGSAGHNSLLNGAGGQATLFGAVAGDTLYATGSGQTTFFAGAGNETLDGSTSTGFNEFHASPSGATLIGFGLGVNQVYLGANSFVYVRGHDNLLVVEQGFTSGVVQVSDFDTRNDKFTLSGFASGKFNAVISSAQVVNIGGVPTTQLAIDNGTVIQLLGVTSITSSIFI